MESKNHSIPVQKLPPFGSIRRTVSFSEPSGIWLLALICSVITVVFSAWFIIERKRSESFRDQHGRPMKEVKVDVRFSKFIASSELSHQGEALAGNEPYLIRSGPFRELVISQPTHIQEFYRHDVKAHSKPPNFNLGEPFGCLMGKAVGAKSGESWRRIRQHFDPEFAFHPIAQITPHFWHEIHQWVDRIMSTPSVVIHVKRSFQFLTFRLLAVHLYGEAFSEPLYTRILELNILHEVIMRDMLASKHPDSKLWNILPTPARRRLQVYLAQWRQFNRQIIREARESDGGQRNLSCPVERIFRGVDQTEDMQEDEFLQTLDEILFTNVDVMLRDEIHSWKCHPDLDLAKYLAKSDTLLNRIVMESMRHSPPFWFSMPECTAIPKVIGGYSIPAHTPVVIDTRRLNRENVTWGPDGADYRPERFSEMPKEKLRCGFMRFGVGAASGRCLGKHVADVVFKLTTMTLIEQCVLSALDTGGAENIQVTRIKDFQRYS